MPGMNPIRKKIINAIQFNTAAAWQFFAAVAFGYAYATYFNLTSRAEAAPDVTSDLTTLNSVALAFCAFMLAFLLLSIVARTARFKTLNRAVNNKPVRVLVTLAGAGGLAYLIAWNAKYIADYGLIVYTDSPYKFLIVLGMASTVILFALYVLFVTLIRYRAGDRAFQRRRVAELGSGKLDMEGTIQNADAFNWIRKFNEGSELRLLTVVAGIAPWLLSRATTICFFVANVALFGATAAVMVIFGTEDPSGNIANARTNIMSIIVIVGWVLTVCVSYATLEFASCNWAAARLSPEDANDAAHDFLKMIYSRFYVTADPGERAKGHRVFEVHNMSSAAPLAQFRFVNGVMTIISPNMVNLAQSLSAHTRLEVVPSKDKADVGAVVVGNSVYKSLALFVFASFWAIALHENGVKR